VILLTLLALAQHPSFAALDSEGGMGFGGQFLIVIPALDVVLPLHGASRL
jgi:hypothetical protein